MSIFSALKETDTRTMYIWQELLSGMKEDLFLEAISQICRNEQVFSNTNIVALIARKAEEINEERNLAYQRAGGRLHEERKREPAPSTRQLVDGARVRVYIGDTWDLGWIQSEFSVDPGVSPQEQCRQCEGMVEYVWVHDKWLYKKWGQKQPCWMRVGCLVCDALGGKENVPAADPSYYTQEEIEFLRWYEQRIREGKGVMDGEQWAEIWKTKESVNKPPKAHEKGFERIGKI